MKSARSCSVIGPILSPLLVALLLQGCSATPGEKDALCGDAIVEASEPCDDGNLEDGDGCSADCQLEEDGRSEAEQIDEFIRSLNDVPSEDESILPNTDPVTEVTDDGNYSCTTQNFTKTVPLESVSILQSATQDLFPGALLAGSSLYTGQFAQVVFDRKPQTYSLSIQDGTSESRSATMQKPSLSEFRDTLGGILEQAQLGNTPINLEAKIQEVRSEQELELAVGFEVDTATVDVAGQFNFANQNLLSHFLVTVDAAYFTADIDPVANPSDLMADSVTLAEVQQKVGPGNPPVYVSSITYGTRFYIAVESTLAAQEVQAALQAAFDGGAVDANGDIALSTRDVLASSTFSVVAVGAADDQLDALKEALNGAPEELFDNLREFSINPAVFNAGFLGAPLTFTMKQLSDNAIVAIAFSGTFDVLSCERISQNIQVTLKSISVEGAADNGDTLEIFGNITAQGLGSTQNPFPGLPGSGSSGVQSIFSLSREQAVNVSDETPFLANGAQFQNIVRIDPKSTNPEVTLRASLTERDGGLNPDDVIPAQSLVINKNSTGDIGEGEQLLGEGFSGEYSIFLPSAEGDLTVTVELRPVP